MGLIYRTSSIANAGPSSIKNAELTYQEGDGNIAYLLTNLSGSNTIQGTTTISGPVQINDTVQMDGAVFMPQLTSASQNSIVTFDSATGRFYYTSSANLIVSNSLFSNTSSFVTASNVYGPFGSNSIISSSISTTASFVTASNVYGPHGSSSVLSSSFAVSASWAPFVATNTGSLLTTASVNLNTITFTKGDGSTFPIIVDTGSVDLGGYVTNPTFNSFTSSYYNDSASFDTRINNIQFDTSSLPTPAITVNAATTGVLPGTALYNNGVSGVGAFISSSANVSLGNIDGVTMLPGDRLLIKNQAAQLQNGVYDVISTGSASSRYILSRSIDSDETVELDSQIVIPSFGTTNAGGIFAQNTNNPVVGTNNIVYIRQTSTLVSQNTAGTQAIYQIPWWTGTARDLSRGSNHFRYINVTSGTTVTTSSLQLTGSFNLSGSAFVRGLTTASQTDVLTYNSSTGQVFFTASSAIGGTTVNTGSLLTTASVSLNTITFTKGDGSTFPITVNTGSGGGGGGTPGGADTEIQFNQGGAFGADSTFKFVYASQSLEQGLGVQGIGQYSHAEGDTTQAIGPGSHAEGSLTQAIGEASHAEGANTIASGSYSHAEGADTQAIGGFSHVEGIGGLAIGFGSHAEGGGTTAIGITSHAEGQGTQAIGFSSHAEGLNTQASGSNSHAEGSSTIASGSYSHAEGAATIASGLYSHAEGYQTVASGSNSHAEGGVTTAIGDYSHAEGQYTQAIGQSSHAEGSNTEAIGEASHAEGRITQAIGNYSHAEGFGTIASGRYQHVQGQLNISSSAESAFIIGNGTDIFNRSNLLFAQGTQFQISGSLFISGAAQSAGNNNVLTYNTTTGLVTYTASAAIGGGGSGLSGGTQYYVPVWTGATTLGTSSLYESGGVLKTISGSNDAGISLNLLTRNYSLGQITGGNQTYILVHDINQNVTFVHNNVTQGIQLQYASDIYAFGKITGGNGTRVSINDTTRTITMSGTSSISGQLFANNLTTGSTSNVLTYDSSTGQVFFTASSAIGGTTVNTSSFLTTGSLSTTQQLSGSLNITGSLNFFSGSTNAAKIENGWVVLSQVSMSLDFANDAAAAAGGVPLGGLYRNGNAISIRIA